jgi:hypothetical protein
MADRHEPGGVAAAGVRVVARLDQLSPGGGASASRTVLSLARSALKLRWIPRATNGSTSQPNIPGTSRSASPTTVARQPPPWGSQMQAVFSRTERRSRSEVSATRRWIAASAAPVWPCASRSRARPGCGSWPHRLASRYASSAAANSPLTRYSSACRYRAAPVAYLSAAWANRSHARFVSSGLRPRPVQLQDLGPVDQTLPGEGDQVRLPPPPG